MRIVKESPRDQIESLSKIIRVFENVTSKLLKTIEIQKTSNSLDFPSFHAFRITLQNVWSNIKYGASGSNIKRKIPYVAI